MRGVRILRGIGVGLVVTAVAAGGAVAAERPDDRGGMLGVGAAETVGVPVAAVRPDDRAGPRGPGALPSVPAAVDIAASDGGFTWADAAFGASAMLGLGLLGVAILGIRRRGGVALR